MQSHSPVKRILTTKHWERRARAAWCLFVFTCGRNSNFIKLRSVARLSIINQINFLDIAQEPTINNFDVVVLGQVSPRTACSSSSPLFATLLFTLDVVHS
jgi:hypothetical protein